MARIRLRMQTRIASPVIKYKSGPLRTLAFGSCLPERHAILQVQPIVPLTDLDKQDNTKVRNKKLEQTKGSRLRIDFFAIRINFFAKSIT